LVVGSPVAARHDSGAEAKLFLKVNEDEQVVEMDCPEGEPVENIRPWGLITLRSVLELGVDYHVEVTFSGKDKPYWGGNFGARFGHCFAFAVED